MKKQVTAQRAVSTTVNKHLLNIITPSGIDYDNVSVGVGEQFGKIYCISKYPTTDGVPYGWLADLCNLEGTSTVVEYRYTDPANIINVFNKRIKDLRADKELAKEESDRQRIEKSIDDLREMIKRITVANEPIGYVNIMLFPQDIDPKNLAARIKRVSSVVQVAGCNLRILKYKQLQALKCVSPYGIPDRLVSNMGDRNMPISTFIGGFPMANYGIRDKGGYYIGKAKNNKLILLNMWLRGQDRVNCNWYIQGLPGSGKSTFIKLLLILEYALGTKLIIFDPEQEYVDLARHQDINGNIIQGAGGNTGRINPLQVRSVPKVTEDDMDPGENIEDYFIYDDDDGTSDLAYHIQNLRVLFKLYFGSENFTAGIATSLEKCLIKTYEKKGITWETDLSNFKPEDYPIISDLYAVVKEEGEKADSGYRKDQYDRLADLLYPAAEGADQFLWNGPTNIKAASAFNVIDCSKLLELADNVRRAQFFNLTTFAWHFMSQDRLEKVLFAADEGYLYIDPEYPDLMKFFRNISKRDRKYEGGLIFITHSLVDILDPSVKRYSQAIIDNSCYKLLMGCDGKNMLETKELFNLSEKEVDILLARKRGQGILFAGAVRMDARIDVDDRLLAMMGKAGGR